MWHTALSKHTVTTESQVTVNSEQQLYALQLMQLLICEKSPNILSSYGDVSGCVFITTYLHWHGKQKYLTNESASKSISPPFQAYIYIICVYIYIHIHTWKNIYPILFMGNGIHCKMGNGKEYVQSMRFPIWTATILCSEREIYLHVHIKARET